jgi:hypothetical protein
MRRWKRGNRKETKQCLKRERRLKLYMDTTSLMKGDKGWNSVPTIYPDRLRDSDLIRGLISVSLCHTAGIKKMA